MGNPINDYDQCPWWMQDNPPNFLGNLMIKDPSDDPRLSLAILFVCGHCDCLSNLKQVMLDYPWMNPDLPGCAKETARLQEPLRAALPDHELFHALRHAEMTGMGMLEALLNPEIWWRK